MSFRPAFRILICVAKWIFSLGILLVGAAMIWGGRRVEGDRARVMSFPPAICVVVHSQPRTVKQRDMSRNRDITWIVPDVRYRFAVDGRTAEASAISTNSRRTSDPAWAESVCARYPVGSQHPCWYDPADPSQAYLERAPDAGGGIVKYLGGFLVLLGLLAPFLSRFTGDR